jgi:hypothetical protein
MTILALIGLALLPLLCVAWLLNFWSNPTNARRDGERTNHDEQRLS